MDKKLEMAIDSKLEKQLSALITQAGDAVHGAVFAILQILRNSYLAGRHNELAKYCCDFPLVEGVVMRSSPLHATEEAPARYIN